jgi:hypothetical protein
VWWLGWRKTGGNGARGGASRQLGRRGVVGDRPEEWSVVLFDGSAGSAVVGLGCGVTERRGAAVDSAAGV